ncbi:hypothetical protein BJ742DRAFT_129011 [Cladochytrium replicatum]|nr:hypothetical protein BJ742DRAFT_129011 [Cladochytrium replicatum]
MLSFFSARHITYLISNISIIPIVFSEISFPSFVSVSIFKMPSPVDPPSLSTPSLRAPSRRLVDDSTQTLPRSFTSISRPPLIPSLLQPQKRSVSVATYNTTSSHSRFPTPPVADDISAILKTEELIADSYSIIPVVKDLIGLILHPNDSASRKNSTAHADESVIAHFADHKAEEKDDDPALRSHSSEELLRVPSLLVDHRKPRCVSCVDLKQKSRVFSTDSNTVYTDASTSNNAAGTKENKTAEKAKRRMSWSLRKPSAPPVNIRKNETPAAEADPDTIEEQLPSPRTPNRRLSLFDRRRSKLGGGLAGFGFPSK